MSVATPVTKLKGGQFALRALYPDGRIYTFWKYFRNAFARDAGLRIDHLLRLVRRSQARSGEGGKMAVRVLLEIRSKLVGSRAVLY